MEQKSLYERLGGAAGIPRLVDAIVTAHMNNPLIKARFLPFQSQPERLQKIKHHIVQFLSMGSGGPQHYEGRSMLDAHRGMNVSAEEYMAATDDILMVLEQHGIDAQTRNDVLAIAYSLKSDILHV